MACNNPSWGEERIANELLLKLGLRVSPRTVRKYLPKSSATGGNPRRDQRWSTFLKNHADAIVACDFCVAATATFRILYVFVVMEHAHSPNDSRQRDGPSHRGLDPPTASRSYTFRS
jgi:hypothetical protein